MLLLASCLKLRTDSNTHIFWSVALGSMPFNQFTYFTKCWWCSTLKIWLINVGILSGREEREDWGEVSSSLEEGFKALGIFTSTIRHSPSLIVEAVQSLGSNDLQRTYKCLQMYALRGRVATAQHKGNVGLWILVLQTHMSQDISSVGI